MEVHCFIPGNRTYVFICEVISRTDRVLIMKGTDKNNIKMEIISLLDNVPINHDMCPPKVKITTTQKNLHDEKETTECIGYMYDLSIMSNVNKIIIFEERGSHKNISELETEQFMNNSYQTKIIECFVGISDRDYANFGGSSALLALYDLTDGKNRMNFIKSLGEVLEANDNPRVVGSLVQFITALDLVQLNQTMIDLATSGKFMDQPEILQAIGNYFTMRRFRVP